MKLTRVLATLGAAPALLTLLMSVATAPVAAQAAKTAATEHVRKDIERHRAMALAHESAARCLESGQAEDKCLDELRKACKGLAIGKYCGMKHEH